MTTESPVARRISGCLVLALVSVAPARFGAPPAALPLVRPNANTARAGVLHDGVLIVALEAKKSTWRLDGPDHPAMSIEAFSEPDKPPLMPGPLVRAPAGTEIRLSVRNSLSVPLTFLLPAAIHRGPDRFTATDSVVVAPGAVGLLTTKASVPGNYIYRATTPSGTSKAWKLAGLLGGALVIDSAGIAPPRDRVLVIMQAMDSAFTANADSSNGDIRHAPPGIARIVYTINGRSWPNTERNAATVDDSLHWRVINATFDVHPMHLHGFYYRVDAFSGAFAPAPGAMVVTQLMTPFSTMSMSWSPDRPGNWLFHCHFALHLLPDSHSAAADDSHHRDMVGLVLGVNVADRGGMHATRQPAAVRHLRLIAVADSMHTRQRSHAGAPSSTPLHQFAADSVPSMHFVLEEHGHAVEGARDFSPEIDLTKGVPVSIMIVNHLAEPTSVHWHGSEELGGLEGALIVRDSGVAPPPSIDDHVFFLKGLLDDAAHPREINGETNPDTVVLHVGRPARLRLINLSTADPVPTFCLTARPDSVLTIAKDTMIVDWRPLAKDGLDLQSAMQAPRPARQIISMGETYDFEYTPQHAGTLRLEVRTSQPLVTVPIRVDR
jgi:FtsP/CotA-like multicopper oxidase with cupredoxin domain